MTKKLNYILWTIQVLLALLFIFTGGMKLLSSPEVLLSQITFLPMWFIRFLGVAELLGGLGLIVPGIFKMNHYLTPLAALGLFIIMVGAVISTIFTMGIVMAIMPFVVGALCIFVAKNRWPRQIA